MILQDVIVVVISKVFVFRGSNVTLPPSLSAEQRAVSSERVVMMSILLFVRNFSPGLVV